MNKNETYVLRYLPLFYEDFSEKINYIANELKNPTAANKLIDDVEKSILERLPNCEAFEKYHSAKERKYPYYRIYVNNFIIYYVDIDDECENKIMEVRRMLYKGQNTSKGKDPDYNYRSSGAFRISIAVQSLNLTASKNGSWNKAKAIRNRLPF